MHKQQLHIIRKQQGVETGVIPSNGSEHHVRDTHRVHSAEDVRTHQAHLPNIGREVLPQMIPHARLYQQSPAPTPLGELEEVDELPDTIEREGGNRSGWLQRY